MLIPSNRNNLCDGTLSPVIHLQNCILNQDGITQLFQKKIMRFGVAGLSLGIRSLPIVFLCAPFTSTSHTKTASKTVRSCVFN